MRKVLNLVFCVAMAALSINAFCDIPNTAEGWYTPAENKYSIENLQATLKFASKNEYGEDDSREYDVWIDEDGRMIHNGEDVTDSLDPKYETIATAIQAYVLATRNLDRIKAIGNNLNNIGLVKGFELTNVETLEKYTITIAAGSLLKAGQQAEETETPQPDSGATTERLIPAFSSQKIAAVDGKSIATNYNGLLTLHGYPNAALHNGKMPRYISSGLEWFSLAALFDGQSVSATPSAQYANLIPDGGISLAGWNAPRTGDAKCMPTLASMLQGNGAEQGAEYDGANHYVLTRYGNPGGEPVLHYTQIGDLQAGNAIKFVGTSGEAVVGRGAQTNVVTFCSATNSNVQVTVKSANGNATITIGVYYK